MQTATSMSASLDGTALCFAGNGATATVSAVSNDVLRLRLSFADATRDAGEKVARPLSAEGLDVRAEAGAASRLRTSALTIEASDAPFHFTLRDAAGQALLQQPETGGLAFERVESGRVRTRARFNIAVDEHFYGLGENGATLDKVGVTRRLWNCHYGHGPGSDIPVPLLLSTRGYGLFFDNSWDAEVHVGRSEGRMSLVYTCEGGELDIYILYGPSLQRLLALYADLVGHAPMPPRWTLGYLQSTRHFADTGEITGLARELRERRIPSDAIIFLSTYSQDKGMNDGVGTLGFQPDLWPEPRPIIDELRGRDFHLVSHEYPVVSPRSPLFAEAQARGYIVDYRGPDTSVMFNEGQGFLDFTRREVADWWWEQHRFLLDMGIDGWWLDGGEGPPSEVELAGGSGQAIHNVFDLYRQRAFYAGERRDRPNQRPWLLCRSGYAGMPAAGAACWSGDINSVFSVFEAQPPLGLNAAMSGLPYWGTDIGGFYHDSTEDPELYTRWFQFGAFCPVFRSHGRGVGPSGWRDHLPWAHGQEIEMICRSYAELRYQMLPYIYSLAWQAHTEGAPLMRPLAMEFPNDPNVFDMGSEYLWGPALLVAPVTRGGARRWPVYLPEGDWYDFWTREKHTGGRWVELDAPLERMPLLARAGAIIPLAPLVQHTGAGESRDLTLLVYPGGGSRFTLYEDDGRTHAYERGEHALTDITAEAGGDNLTITIGTPRGSYEGMSSERRVVLQVLSPSAPGTVTLNGAPLPRLMNHPDEYPSVPGWWHDGASFLWVNLGPVEGETRIEVRGK